MNVVLCARCGLQNPSISIQCGKCGFPLSDEAALCAFTGEIGQTGLT